MHFMRSIEEAFSLARCCATRLTFRRCYLRATTTATSKDMASIIQMANGKWRVQVRRKPHGHQCKTFEKKADAQKWGRAMEAQIDSGAAPKDNSTITVTHLIKVYEDARAKARPILDTSTEFYALKKLKGFFGDKIAVRLKPQDFVDFAVMRREEGAGPYTINMDISKLGTVMRLAAATLAVHIPDAVLAARPVLLNYRLISGGGKRERRPTEHEFATLLTYLAEHYGQIYADIVLFAALSTFRRGECCTLRRSDIDNKNLARIWRKHPRLGKQLQVVPIVPEAWEVVKRQPESPDGRIFPVHPQTVSKYFKESCRALSIPDLHFHDMRHEGTSRLFEQGKEIQQVAMVTGHKSWAHLKRYTNLKPESMSQPTKVEE